MRLMNHILQSLIGQCVVIYFDDILVYTKRLDNHDESLYVNLEKCTIFTTEVIFLGFVISSKGVRVDKEKVKAIQYWPIPTNVSDVQSFHGLASFNKCFVREFNTITTLLNEIITKDMGFKSKDP
ncbi:Retrovirus-related Pol polyprotein from transposon 17.6, partial [Mucuna pruriens]